VDLKEERVEVSLKLLIFNAEEGVKKGARLSLKHNFIDI